MGATRPEVCLANPAGGGHGPWSNFLFSSGVRFCPPPYGWANVMIYAKHINFIKTVGKNVLLAQRGVLTSGFGGTTDDSSCILVHKFICTIARIA